MCPSNLCYNVSTGSLHATPFECTRLPSKLMFSLPWNSKLHPVVLDTLILHPMTLVLLGLFLIVQTVVDIGFLASVDCDGFVHCLSFDCNAI